MKLTALFYHAELQMNLAKAAYDRGENDVTKEHLGHLYDLLDDEVGSKAREKCESDESSNGS